jgi:hypothetical protein
LGPRIPSDASNPAIFYSPGAVKLKPINDTSMRSIAAKIVAEVVDETYRIKRNWLDAKGYMAVPVESGGHFKDEDTPRLHYAISKTGHRTCLAIATEEALAEDFCFEVSTSEEGLRTFSFELTSLNYLLEPVRVG